MYKIEIKTTPLQIWTEYCLKNIKCTRNKLNAKHQEEKFNIMHFEVRKNKEIRAQTAVIMQMRVDIMRPIRESSTAHVLKRSVSLIFCAPRDFFLTE